MSNIIRENILKTAILEKNRQIGSLLDDAKKVKKFSAVLLSAGMDYNLSKCTPQSVIEAGLGAAMLGLSVDKNIGQAYLVAYGSKCQLQIGYRGYIALLNRIGWSIKVITVYTCDTFNFKMDGWDEKLEFSPNYEEHQNTNEWIYKNLNKIVTMVKNPNGEIFYNIVTKNEIEKIRMKSPSQKNASKPSNIWADWYEDMAIKTAIKKHIKRLPIGDEVAQSLALDDYAMSGRNINYGKTVEDGIIVEDAAQKELHVNNKPADINAMLLNKSNESVEELHVEDDKAISMQQSPNGNA